MRIIKYTIEGVSSNLSDSSQYEITWSTLSSCVALQCLIGNNGAEFAISDEVEGCNPCIQYTIRTIGCTNCPNIIKTICFCNESGDCPPCHTCIDGECVAICDNCDPVTGDCVDCKDDDDCPGDMICIQGGCQCPQGKWDPISSKCVECIQGEVNPNNKCLICSGNKWTTKICTNGVVDPKTCECTGCNDSGDCKGPNECCYDGVCLCCKDTAVYDPTTKTCIPKPPCGPDTPCPACYNCVNGQCVPRICADGYICIEELDSCVPECDCNQPTCNTKNACITSNSGKCYCSPCEGGCASNNDCGPGCYCDNGQCKPKPCKGTCSNGTDCGPGCGCLDGECVPCGSVNCATNPTLCGKILGCKCDGNACTDAVGCNETDCTTTSNCNKGCTCDGGECQECANYSCEDCSNHPGCKCVGGVCVSDPDYTCSDTFELIKVDDICDLKAELTMKDKCSCNALTVDSKMRSISGNNSMFNLNFIVELRKGHLITSPRVDDTSNSLIADNDTPTKGAVKLTIVQTNSVQNKTTHKIVYNESKIEITKIFVGLGVVNFDDISINRIGNILSESATEIVKVYSYSFKFEHTEEFRFVNGCNYKSGSKISEYIFPNNTVLDTYVGQTGLSYFDKFIVLKTNDSRNPRFTWSKGKTLLEKFRSVYVPKQGNKYIDTLFGPGKIDPKGDYPLKSPNGELYSGLDWIVTNDCACAEDATLNNVVFCNPKNITVEFNSCNTAIKITNFPIPCDVNQDIRQFNKPGYTVPDSAQVLYELWINGSKFKTFVHNKILGKMVVWNELGSGDTRYTSQDAVGIFMPTENEKEIKTAVIKLNHGGSCDLNFTVPPITPKDFTYQIDCNGGNSPGTYKITVNKGAGENEVVSVEGATIAGNTFVLYAPKGQNFTIKAKFKNCGKKEKVVNECGCEDFNPTVTLSGNDFCTSGSITISGTNINGSVLKYTEDGIQKEITSFPYTTNTNTTKTITLVSIERNGCKIDLSDSKTITKLDKPTLTLTADKTSICSGDTVVLTVNGTQGATFDLWKGGAKEQTGLTANTTINVSPTSSASYQLKNIKLNSCTGNDSNVVTISVTPGMQEPIVTQDCGISNTNTTVNFNSNVTYNGVTNNQFIVPSNIGTMTVSYGSGVCSKTMTVQINNCNCPTITANLTGPSTVCTGDTATFSVSGITGGMAPYTYSWFYCGNVLPYTGNSISFVVNYSCSLEVIITDSQGCYVTKSINVTASNAIPLTFYPNVQGDYTMSNDSSSIMVCNNVNIITLVPNPPGNYNWSVVSGSYTGTISNPNQALQIEMSKLASGTIIRAESISSCPSSFELQIIKQDCECFNQPTVMFDTTQTPSSSIGTNPITLYVNVTNNPTGLHTWSKSGTGSLSYDNVTNIVYTPSISDVSNGSVTITYTIPDQDLTGPCTGATASITITLLTNICCNDKFTGLPAVPSRNINLSFEPVGDDNFVILSDIYIVNVGKTGCSDESFDIFGDNGSYYKNGSIGWVNSSYINGTKKFILYNGSICTDEEVVNGVKFAGGIGSPQVPLTNLSDVVSQINSRLNAAVAPYNVMSISITAPGVLTIEGGPECIKIYALVTHGKRTDCVTQMLLGDLSVTQIEGY